MIAFNLETLLLLALAFLLGLGLGLLLARRLRPAGAGGEGTAQSAVSPFAAATLLGPNGKAASALPSDSAEHESHGKPAEPEGPAPSGGPERAAAPHRHGAPPAQAEPDLFSRFAGPAGGPNGAEAADAPVPANGGDGHPGVRPPTLDAPQGAADDLKLLKGIGPQNERRLHALGIFHFRQIAAWTPEEVAWVGSYLAFPGRIEREGWIGQAKAFAAGEVPPEAPRRRR